MGAFEVLIPIFAILLVVIPVAGVTFILTAEEVGRLRRAQEFDAQLLGERGAPTP
jgi:hypothetical protein